MVQRPSQLRGRDVAAIKMQEEAYADLASEGAWRDERGGVPVRMRSVAALCARAGQSAAAAKLLQLALRREGDLAGEARSDETRLCHLKTRPELNDQTATILKWHRHSERFSVRLGNGECIAVRTADLHLATPLHAAQLLLQESAPPPWPAALVALSRGVEAQFAALVKAILLPDGGPRFVAGMPVMVWVESFNGWASSAHIVEVDSRTGLLTVDIPGEPERKQTLSAHASFA